MESDIFVELIPTKKVFLVGVWTSYSAVSEYFETAKYELQTPTTDMKIVIEKGSSGGGYSNIVEHFFAEGRNSLKNMLNRQQITWSVCEKKISTNNSIWRKS